MRARASCCTRPSPDGSILKRSGRRFGRGLRASSSRLRCSSSFFQGLRWNKAQKLLDLENFKRSIRTAGKEALQDKEKKPEGWFYTWVFFTPL